LTLTTRKKVPNFGTYLETIKVLSEASGKVADCKKADVGMIPTSAFLGILKGVTSALLHHPQLPVALE
jgi:hypothetical protein